MKKEEKTIQLDNGKTITVPVNYQNFILSYGSDPEEHGYDKDDVIEILKCVQEGRLEDLNLDGNLMNDIGTFFDDGVCVKSDIEKAVFWYEKAIEDDNDLARSNLADVLRKGSKGYPKDLERAFKLYKDCGLPYAHYRVGEFYEHGWGVEANKELAKKYYQLAYKEGHGLAKKKLKEWNFME